MFTQSAGDSGGVFRSAAAVISTLEQPLAAVAAREVASGLIG